MPNRAFLRMKPSLMVSLNPLPVVRRKEYVMFLLRMNRAYEVYPKELHDYVDDVAYEYRDVADTWLDLIKLFEDKDHPVRSQPLNQPTREELFLKSLTKDERDHLEVLYRKNHSEEYNNPEKFLRSFDRDYIEKMRSMDWDEFKNHPFVKTTGPLHYLTQFLDGKIEKPKTVEELDEEQDQKIQEYYDNWKKKLSKMSEDYKKSKKK